MSQIRTLKLNVKAGISQDLVVTGNIIGLINADVPIKFEIEENGSSFTLEKGQEAVYLNNEIFYNFKISHTSGTDQIIEVAVGKNAHVVQQKSISDVNIVSSATLTVTGVNLTASNVTITQKPQATLGYAYLVTSAGVGASTVQNSNRRAIHFRNTSLTTDCYLAAFSAPNKGACPILLKPNEMLLIDDRTAAAQWKAFSDGGDLTLVVQESIE